MPARRPVPPLCHDDRIAVSHKDPLVMTQPVRTLAALLALLCGTAGAGDLVAPPTLVHNGVTYRQAYTWGPANGSSGYEYVSGTDTVDQWQTLVTLVYVHDPKIGALDYARRNKAMLDAMRPVPSYHFEMQDTSGSILVIYPPNDRYKTWEANVQVVEQNPACNGVVAYQFARHYPASTTEKTVMTGLLESWKVMRAANWHPTCK